MSCGGEARTARSGLVVSRTPESSRATAPSQPRASMSKAPRPARLEQPLAQLRRAGAGVGAADVLVALLLVGQRRAARGAVGGHDELALGAVAQVDDRPEDLGDDVAGLAQHDGVTDEHALAPAPRGRCAGSPSTRWTRRRSTGSITPNGVTRPVRPTLTWMSRSLVLTSSGGYLKAIAQRGARDVEPSRRCTAISSTLTTTPSISCSTLCRCSPVVLDERLHLGDRCRRRGSGR